MLVKNTEITQKKYKLKHFSKQAGPVEYYYALIFIIGKLFTKKYQENKTFMAKPARSCFIQKISLPNIQLLVSKFTLLVKHILFPAPIRWAQNRAKYVACPRIKRRHKKFPSKCATLGPLVRSFLTFAKVSYFCQD